MDGRLCRWQRVESKRILKKGLINMLKEIMEEKNITSQQLADATGIPKRTIDEYRGARRKEPSLSRGLKLAAALGVKPEELIK